MPGVCGSSGWLGVLLPSVDKVGRYFPLTMAVALDAQFDVFGAIYDIQAWHSELERIALLALSVEFSVEDIELELANHPFPVLESVFDATPYDVDGLSRWWLSPQHAPESFAFADIFHIDGALHCSLPQAIRTIVAGKTLWWSAPAMSGPAVLHCCAGLPPDDYFATLMQGGSSNTDATSAGSPLGTPAARP
jgi:type VI secretion system protein ImpM